MQKPHGEDESLERGQRENDKEVFTRGSQTRVRAQKVDAYMEGILSYPPVLSVWLHHLSKEELE